MASSEGIVIEGKNKVTLKNCTLTDNNTITNTDSTGNLLRTQADSYVTSFTDADSSYSNINFNGYKLYVNGTAIN